MNEEKVIYLRQKIREAIDSPITDKTTAEEIANISIGEVLQPEQLQALLSVFIETSIIFGVAKNLLIGKVEEYYDEFDDNLKKSGLLSIKSNNKEQN